jgi:hypothetical protein
LAFLGPDDGVVMGFPRTRVWRGASELRSFHPSKRAHQALDLWCPRCMASCGTS